MFELTTPQSATLAGVVPRKEYEGDDERLAVSLAIRISAPNTLLDRLSPTLRDALFKADPNQAILPGVEPTTPKRRCPDLERVALSLRFMGWTLKIEHGPKGKITLAGCKIDKFRVDPLEDGKITLTFRAGTHAVTPAEVGLLCDKLGDAIVFTLEAPEPSDEPRLSDADIAARRPLPVDKRQSDLTLHDGPPQSAIDVFAAQHGTREQKTTAARPPKGN